LNEFGIIKSNSNLTKLNGGYETKYSVILHQRSNFTKLLVTNLHFQFEHPVSFAAVKASVRKHYVILGLGILYAQIKTSYPQCKKLRAAPMKQQMAPLPKQRVNARMNPFEHVGINYAGPFKLKIRRAKAKKKVLILVMTCMSVRTVNFKVTLQSIEKVSKHTGLVFRPMSSGITWHLNLPLASHFGGIFEIMVKAMKQAMKATIGRADLDEEEFKTTVSKNGMPN